MGLPSVVVYFIKVSKVERRRETASKMELTILCDIIWKWHCIIFDTVYWPDVIASIAHNAEDVIISRAHNKEQEIIRT